MQQIFLYHLTWSAPVAVLSGSPKEETTAVHHLMCWIEVDNTKFSRCIGIHV